MARIGFLLPNLHGGGAERIAIFLIRGFIAAGHEVELVLCQAEGALIPEVPPSVRIVDLRAPRFRNALRPLLHYFRNTPPDAVQVSMWPLTIIALVAARLSGGRVPVITSDHVPFGAFLAERPARLRSVAMTMRLFYPQARARIAVSGGVADELARLSGLPRDAFQVIHNPVELPSPSPSSIADAAATWGTAKLRLLAAGSLLPVKNFELLLDAVAAMDPLLDWHLVILGEGPERDRLQARIRELGIGDRVSMPGFNPAPSNFFHAADVFVLTSNYEGLPTVLIEALQAGLRIVSTDCESGPREVLAGAPLAQLVPPRDPRALAEAIAEMAATIEDRPKQRVFGDRFRGPKAATAYLEAMGLR